MNRYFAFGASVARPAVAGLAWFICVSINQSGMAATMHTRAAVADTYITESPNNGGPNSTHGSETTLRVFSQAGHLTRPLVRFDLSSLAGTAVTSPTATLSLVLLTTDPGQSSISVHEQLAPFSESLSTWNSLGGGSPGGVLDTIVVQPSFLGTRRTWTLPANLIQKWIDTPALNHGLILLPLSTASAQFESREGLNPSFPQPALLNFSSVVVPEPASLGLVLLPGAALVFARRG